MTASLIILGLFCLGLLWSLAKMLAAMDMRNKLPPESHPEYKVGIKDNASNQEKD